jgi:predicted Zn-dependent protease
MTYTEAMILPEKATKMKRLILSLAIICLLVLTNTAIAFADTTVHSYSWKKNIPIYTGPSITNVTKYNDARNNAVLKWNQALNSSTVKSRYIIYTTGESAGKTGGIYYRGKKYGTNGWAGLTSSHLTNSTTIKNVDVQINFTYLSGESSANNKHVATHELGHSLGLTHAIPYLGPRVMHPGSYDYTVPQPKDIASLAQLY